MPLMLRQRAHAKRERESQRSECSQRVPSVTKPIHDLPFTGSPQRTQAVFEIENERDRRQHKLLPVPASRVDLTEGTKCGRC